MKKTILNLSFITCVCILASCENKNNNTNNTETDSKKVAEDMNEEKFDRKDENVADFVVNAYDQGLLEIQLGELAQTNATSSEVKKLAKTIAEEHRKSNEELKNLAMTKHITLPAVMGEKCQEKYNDIAKKMGSTFDKAYSDYMVDDHKKDIDKFKDQAEKGNDPDVRSWAAGKLSAMEQHLQMAETTQDAVKENSASMK